MLTKGSDDYESCPKDVLFLSSLFVRRSIHSFNNYVYCQTKLCFFNSLYYYFLSIFITDTATVLSPFCRQLNPQMTSTPFEPTESVKGKRACNFYSKSSSIFEEPPAVASQKEKNGFTGFKRLLDRLGKRQLQIDAGQERFGAKTCTRCGMIFSQGEADDEKQHERFHKQMLSAVRFKVSTDCTQNGHERNII